MARARNIKPGFFKNDALAECGLDGRLLFAGLWTLADRAGRLENRPARIKAELFPYEVDAAVDIPKLLNLLRDRGFVWLYRVGVVDYIQILQFSRHQNPHQKEVESTIPAPEIPVPVEEKPMLAVLIPDSLLPDSLIPSEPLSTENVDAEVEVIRKAYPRMQGKPKSTAAIKKAIKRETKFRGSVEDAARFLLKRATVYRHYNAEWPPGDRKQYTPLCATWFNDERYNDEDSTYQRQIQNGKAEQRASEIEDAGRKAARLLGIRRSSDEVLQPGARPAEAGDRRESLPEREPHPRVLDGSIRVLPKPERQRLPADSRPVDCNREEP